jgi:hypothetical protein
MYRFYGKFNIPEEWGLNFMENSHVVLSGIGDQPLVYLEIEFSKEERCLIINGESESEPNFYFFANRKPSHQGRIRDTGKLFTLYYMVLPHDQRKLPESAIILNYHNNDIHFIQNREIGE